MSSYTSFFQNDILGSISSFSEINIDTIRRILDLYLENLRPHLRGGFRIAGIFGIRFDRTAISRMIYEVFYLWSETARTASAITIRRPDVDQVRLEDVEDAIRMLRQGESFAQPHGRTDEEEEDAIDIGYDPEDEVQHLSPIWSPGSRSPAESSARDLESLSSAPSPSPIQDSPMSPQ